MIEILLLSLISVGQVVRLYFSYEDLSFFYAFQFPQDAYRILYTIENGRHGALLWLFKPQFLFFGYNPLGYYIVSILLFIILNFTVYYLVRLIYPLDKKLALYTAIIQSSAYIGIEAFTWNMAAGPDVVLFLILSIICLILVYIFSNIGKKIVLLLLILIWTIAVYFFQFRSFLLFVWLPLFVFLFVKNIKISFKIKYLLTPILLISGIALFFKNLISHNGRIEHVGINIKEFANLFFKNFANLFTYNIFLEKDLIEFLFGICIFIFFLLMAFVLYKTKNKSFKIFSFFFIGLVSSLILILLATAFTGQVPTIWPSTHRFFITLLPFYSGLLATTIYSAIQIFKNKKIIILIPLIVIINVIFSNQSIYERWNLHSKYLEYFYKNIKNMLPSVDKSSVVLVNLQGSPRALSPFVAGYDMGGNAYLAGIYHIKMSDLNSPDSPIEAVKTMVEKDINEDKLFSFDYTKDNLQNETQDFRSILRSGKTININNAKIEDDKASLEIKGLDVSMASPVFLKFQAKIEPKIEINRSASQNYFNIFLRNEKYRLETKATSNATEDPQHKIVNVIDNKYDTVWIPLTWPKDGAKLVLDIGEPRIIDKIVWASSRTGPWYFRSPSDYSIDISIDGKNYSRVKEVANADNLKTGEYFVENFKPQKARYVKLTITKTLGGWTPAVDEIEAFNSEDVIKDFDDYFVIKREPYKYFSNYGYASNYLNNILKNNIPVKISWIVDNNTNYSSSDSVETVIKSGKFGEYTVFIPRTGRTIKSVKITSSGIPIKISLGDSKIWYPSLEEFKLNRKLLDN